MKLRTEIQPLQLKGKISHDDRIFLIGSCFTDTIGSRLGDALFSVCSNPFGTVYNPASIAMQLERIRSQKMFSSAELVRNNDMFHSFMAHSSLSSVSEQQAIAAMNSAVREADSFLKTASVAIVTLGSSMVYRLHSSGEIVANCHKFPPSDFSRSMLSLSDVIQNLESIRYSLKDLSPEMTIIFTVSPIRYVSDGLHGNQLSKARLLLGIEEICDRYSDDCIYFPSYEVLMDDLRDYRFYDADMKHPSSVAADYVFELFSQSFFNSRTIEIESQAVKLTRRLSHRPLTDNEEANTKFKIETKIQASRLAEKYPELAEAIYKRLEL